jgi:hypothetical protein
MRVKTCKRCQIIKPIEIFVTVDGFQNPRGKYCIECHNGLAKEGINALMDGRDSCLYCGREIPISPTGKPLWNDLEKDHMDPRSRGG